MAKKSVEVATEVAQPKMSRHQFLSGLKEIHPDAYDHALNFFSGRATAGRKNLKKFLANATTAKLQGNARLVHEVLQTAGEPKTISEWAELLAPYFEGKTTNLENVIRSNKQLLETVGAISEVSA